MTTFLWSIKWRQVGFKLHIIYEKERISKMMKYSGVHLSTQGSFYWIPTSIHVHFWALSWKDVFPNIKEFLVSFQGTSFIQVRECLSSPFSGYCTFCFSTHPTENRAPKRIGTTGRLPFIILLFIAFLSTTWRFVTTLHWASPSEPFSQQYLLISCLCHILVISKIFLIILFVMVIF